MQTQSASSDMVTASCLNQPTSSSRNIINSRIAQDEMRTTFSQREANHYSWFSKSAWGFFVVFCKSRLGPHEIFLTYIFTFFFLRHSYAKINEYMNALSALSLQVIWVYMLCAVTKDLGCLCMKVQFPRRLSCKEQTLFFKLG